MKKPRCCSVRDFRAGLRRLERELVSSLRDETGCCGVGLLQCHVLLELEAAGDLSLKDLENLLGSDKASLSRTVDSLVEAGLVGRRDNPADRRSLAISLTEAGRRKTGEVNLLCDKKYEDVLTRLPAAVRNAALRSVLEIGRALAACRIGGDAGCCGRPSARKGEVV
jgi:DNA-binding MarR family transcriptional regulator